MKSIREIILSEVSIKESMILNMLKDIIKGTEFEGKAFVAGGFVRDELLGKPSKDIDVVVELPEGGIRLATYVAKKLGVYNAETNPVTYPHYGTAMLHLNNVVYNKQDLSGGVVEFVMSRKESYTSGSRKPATEHGTLLQDVERRDFTLNTLLKNLTTGEIIDLTGRGKKDLRDNILITPLDPDKTFEDDPLRMLRAIRFACKYGFKIPPFIMKAIAKNAYRLEIISKERIQEELNKILISPRADVGMKALVVTGMSKYIMPELDALRGLEQGIHHTKDALGHTLEVLKNVPDDLKTRLSALFHDIGKPATQQIIGDTAHFYEHEHVGADIAKAIMLRLKYPTEIIDAVCAAVKAHMRFAGFKEDPTKLTDKALRRFAVDLKQHLEHTLDVIHSDIVAHKGAEEKRHFVPKIRKRLKEMPQIEVKQHVKLPISGDDIMKMGVKQGPKVGKILKALEDEYLGNPHMTREEALEFVRNQL
jgi:poly(A) polymerase